MAWELVWFSWRSFYRAYPCCPLSGSQALSDPVGTERRSAVLGWAPAGLISSLLPEWSSQKELWFLGFVFTSPSGLTNTFMVPLRS